MTDGHARANRGDLFVAIYFAALKAADNNDVRFDAEGRLFIEIIYSNEAEAMRSATNFRAVVYPLLHATLAENLFFFFFFFFD